jgi:hypothetical protein
MPSKCEGCSRWALLNAKRLQERRRQKLVSVAFAAVRRRQVAYSVEYQSDLIICSTMRFGSIAQSSDI